MLVLSGCVKIAEHPISPKAQVYLDLLYSKSAEVLDISNLKSHRNSQNESKLRIEVEANFRSDLSSGEPDTINLAVVLKKNRKLIATLNCLDCLMQLDAAETYILSSSSELDRLTQVYFIYDEILEIFMNYAFKQAQYKAADVVVTAFQFKDESFVFYALKSGKSTVWQIGNSNERSSSTKFLGYNIVLPVFNPKRDSILIWDSISQQRIPVIYINPETK